MENVNEMVETTFGTIRVIRVKYDWWFAVNVTFCRNSRIKRTLSFPSWCGLSCCPVKWHAARQINRSAFQVIALLSICTVFLTCCAVHAIVYRKSAYSDVEDSVISSVSISPNSVPLLRHRLEPETRSDNFDTLVIRRADCLAIQVNI